MQKPKKKKKNRKRKNAKQIDYQEIFSQFSAFID